MNLRHLPAALLILGGALLPLAGMIRYSLAEPTPAGWADGSRWTLDNYADLFRQHDAAGRVVFTVAFALGVTAAALAVALPISWWVARQRHSVQTPLLFLLFLPKLLGLPAWAYSFLLLLGEARQPWQAFWESFGIREAPPLSPGWLGAGVAEVALLAPYFVLMLWQQWRRIDPLFVAVARGLGATPRQILTKVVLPLGLPTIVLCIELGLLWSLAAVIGPTFLGSPSEATLAVEIQRTAFENRHLPRAAALGSLLLLLLALAWIGIRFLSHGVARRRRG